MNHTPADVLAEALVQASLVTRPSSVAAGQQAVWPIYIGHLPDSPDNAVAVYDTGGFAEGRIMKTGVTQRKPAWQVRVRATEHNTAYRKIREIADALDMVLRLAVDVDGTGYTIAAVTQTGDILPLGMEPDSRKRNGFTLNGTITHSLQEL